MLPVLSVAQVRDAEAKVMESTTPGTLMQRASRGLATRCMELLREERGMVRGSHVAVLVGSGNNGGDALWAAALLAERSCAVSVIPVSDSMHEEGLQAALRAGARVVAAPRDQERALVEADLVLDGIVGIGGSGAVREPAASLLTWAQGSLIVAVDVPSGLDSDTGIAHEPCVHADVTVTFGALKPGLVLDPVISGEVDLVDIGLELPEDPAWAILDVDDVADCVPLPAGDAYKYSRGVVAIAAGSERYPGAAFLVAAGALPSGVGMVQMWNRGSARSVVERYPTVVLVDGDPTMNARATAWVCGPGLGEDTDAVAVVRAVLAVDVPLVLDASALTLVAADDSLRALVRNRAALTVITPHAGEFARLFPHIPLDDRLQAALQAAREWECIVVVKGPGTVIADASGNVRIDTEGSADLATAGSGDVLAGLIGGMLAQSTDNALDRVAAAIWLHGAAGQSMGDQPATAGSIAEALSAVIAQVRSHG